MNNSNDELYFPEIITFNLNYQKENFWLCRNCSARSESLHYKILLPLSLQPISIEPIPIDGINNFYNIGCYQPIPETQLPAMEVNVAYEYIEKEIDASDWLEKITFLFDEKIIKRKDYYSVSGKYSDILTISDFEGDKIVSRMRVFKNYDFQRKGANLILVKASCPQENYTSLAEYFLHSVKYFTLINDSKWHLTEQLKSINLYIPTNYSFYYPESWQHNERYNSEKMSYFSLSLKEGKQLYGRIAGYFLSRQNEINKEFRSAIMQKLNFNKHIFTEKIRLNEHHEIFNKNISELWSDTITLKNKQNNNGELTVFAGRIENTWFYLIGTSPDKETNFMSWAVVKRTIDIIINSLNNYKLAYEDKFYQQP